MEIRCPNCDYTMWLKQEYFVQGEEYSFYRCNNNLCLSTNTLRPNLTNDICLNNNTIQHYKFPLYHTDGKVYYIHSHYDVKQTVIFVEEQYAISNIITLDKFCPIKLNEPINLQLSAILTRILNLVNFK